MRRLTAFSGRRLTVLDWELHALEQMLGKHAEGFNLAEFFFALDAELARNGEVMPPLTHQWLKERCFMEARKRGLPVVPGVPKFGKLTTRLLSIIDNIRKPV